MAVRGPAWLAVVLAACACLLIGPATAGVAATGEWTLTWEYQVNGLAGGATVTFTADIAGGPVRGSAPLLIQGEGTTITGTFVLDGTIRDGVLYFRPQGSAATMIGEFFTPIDLFQSTEEVAIRLERGSQATVAGQAVNTFRVDGPELYRLRVDVWQPLPAQPPGRRLPRGHRAGIVAHWGFTSYFRVVGLVDDLSLLDRDLWYSRSGWSAYSRPAGRYGERVLPVGPFGTRHFLRKSLTATGVLNGRIMTLTTGPNLMGLTFWTTLRRRVIGQTVVRTPMPNTISTRRELRYRRTCWQASPLPAAGRLEPANCRATRTNPRARDPLARRIVIDQQRIT